ncbi:MAG: Sulfate/thiosulfate import ATP-binding protein CysA [Pseudomonadota bacterium]
MGGVFWVDLRGAAHDAITVQASWDALRAQYPRWNPNLLQDLAEELGMSQHLDKRLHMLSASSRRKVMVADHTAPDDVPLVSVLNLDEPR